MTVGSNSNATENGGAAEANRTFASEVDVAAKSIRLLACGLGNPNDRSWNLESAELWAAFNERYEISSDFVSDCMTVVKKRRF